MNIRYTVKNKPCFIINNSKVASAWLQKTGCTRWLHNV